MLKKYVMTSKKVIIKNGKKTKNKKYKRQHAQQMRKSSDLLRRYKAYTLFLLENIPLEENADENRDYYKDGRIKEEMFRIDYTEVIRKLISLLPLNYYIKNVNPGYGNPKAVQFAKNLKAEIENDPNMKKCLEEANIKFTANQTLRNTAKIVSDNNAKVNKELNKKKKT